MKVRIQTNLPISNIALLNLEKFFVKYFSVDPERVEKLKGA